MPHIENFVKSNMYVYIYVCIFYVRLGHDSVKSSSCKHACIHMHLAFALPFSNVHFKLGMKFINSRKVSGWCRVRVHQREMSGCRAIRDVASPTGNWKYTIFTDHFVRHACWYVLVFTCPSVVRESRSASDFFSKSVGCVDVNRPELCTSVASLASCGTPTDS